MSAGTKQANPIRVLLVDDHPLVRTALRELINRERDLTVCGEAASQSEALTAMAASRPDLAIVDLKLKDSDGMELIKDIRDRHPETFILVVSMHDELLHAERAIRAGAHGFFSKQEDSGNILHAIHRILAGEIYCSEKVALHAAVKIGHPVRIGKDATAVVDLLSENELQVFELIGGGYSPREVANSLHISVSTVETYQARIKVKLALKDAAELRREAIRWCIAKATR